MRGRLGIRRPAWPKGLDARKGNVRAQREATTTRPQVRLRETKVALEAFHGEAAAAPRLPAGLSSALQISPDQTPPGLRRPNRASRNSASRHRITAFRSLQQTVGNRAVQRLLHSAEPAPAVPSSMRGQTRCGQTRCLMWMPPRLLWRRRSRKSFLFQPSKPRWKPRAAPRAIVPPSRAHAPLPVPARLREHRPELLRLGTKLGKSKPTVCAASRRSSRSVRPH